MGKIGQKQEIEPKEGMELWYYGPILRKERLKSCSLTTRLIVFWDQQKVSKIGILLQVGIYWVTDQSAGMY